jgi:hypothetical protein
MTKRGRPRNRHKEQFWRQTLQRFERSGLSATRFCQLQQLSLPSFWAWKRTLLVRDRVAAASQPSLAQPTAQPCQPVALPLFLPLRLQQPADTVQQLAEPLVEVLLPNGLRLRLPQHCDPAALQRLLPLLGVPSC